MRGGRGRLGALAHDLHPGKAPRARRAYARSFDDGTTIELQTEEEIYRPRAIPSIDESGDGEAAFAPAPAATLAQGFSHFKALRATTSPRGRRAIQPPSPREGASRRARRRRRAEELSAPSPRGLSDALAADLATAPAPRADAAETLLDPEVLKKDLQGLTSAKPGDGPSPEASAPAAAPSPGEESVEPPRLTHEVFDDLLRGQAGPALAAMKSAAKAPGPGHAIFDRFPRGLAHAATYDVGTFDVKRRFDELDRQLNVAWAPPTLAAVSSETAPALLPFELRADLEQMRTQAAAAPGSRIVPLVDHNGEAQVAQEPEGADQ